MSYFVAYVVTEKDEPPVDGDQIASGRGWLSWADWAAEKAADCPHAAHLAEEGWIEPAEALAALENELGKLLAEPAPRAVRGVTERLALAVRSRPAGCLGLIVTDGAG